MPTNEELQEIRGVLVRQEVTLNSLTRSELDKVHGLLQHNDRHNPAQQAQKHEQLIKVMTRCRDWETGYEMIGLVLEHVQDNELWRNQSRTGAIAAITVQLSPSVGMKGDHSFCDALLDRSYEVLPAFSRALARWNTFTGIMDTLLLRYPQASFTKLCCDYSGLAKVWLVEDRPVHPVLFEVSEASRRRWRLLHSIVFACKWRSVHTGWPLPEGVRNAIGAFRVPLPGENQRGLPTSSRNHEAQYSHFTASLRKTSAPPVLRARRSF